MFKYGNNTFIKILIVLLILSNTFYTIYLKYSFNEISLNVFTLNYLGNIFNLLLAVLILLGLFLNLVRKKKLGPGDFNIILILALLPLIFLILTSILNGLQVNFLNGYFLGLPLKKVVMGLLFFLDLFSQLYLMFVLWGFIIDRNFISYSRSIYVSIFSILFMLFFCFFYTSISANGKFTQDEPKYDVAVILGAAVWSNNKPSPIFEGRIKKAYELYQKGYASRIQLTGGNAPGEKSEAETAYNYLVNLGVSAENIIVENKTSTTAEQIHFIKDKLIRSKKNERIAIISDKFHLKRILEMCRFFDIDASGIASDYILNWDKSLFYRVRESFALLIFWFFAI